MKTASVTLFLLHIGKVSLFFVKEANILVQFTDKILHMIFECKFLVLLNAKVFILSLYQCYINL